jgi:AcrR family transcriptional regulator
MRVIAERAGITSPVLYRHFDSKDALYREAFLEPLDSFIEGLTEETHQLAARSDMHRIKVLQGFHELFLGYLQPVGPLLAASLFARSPVEPTFYEFVVIPRMRALMEDVFPDLSGLSTGSLDMDVMARALTGLYFGIVEESVMQDRPLDTAEAARQLSSMFGIGLVPTVRRSATFPPLPGGFGTFSLNSITGSTSGVKVPRARRRQMVQIAAREVFFESGVNGAKNKDVATRAGITEAFLYQLFETKDELYVESVERPVVRGFGELATQVRMLAHDRTGVAFLHSLNELCLRFFAEHAPVVATALYSDLRAGRRLYADLRPHLTELGHLIHDGLATDSDLEPETVRQALLGAYMGVGFDRQLVGRPDRIADVASELTTIFTGGIRRD